MGLLSFWVVFEGNDMAVTDKSPIFGQEFYALALLNAVAVI